MNDIAIRVLNQDPFENTLSFICSSNNNIKRITQMIDSLCKKYSTPIEFNGKYYYPFPSIDSLSHPELESELRILGFGYRAKYIAKTVQFLLSDPDYLMKLRTENIDTARQALLKLSGVGPKVADCIMLFSLNKPSIVPIDTHVYQIAVRDYKVGKTKSGKVTSESSKEISNAFKEIFGDYCGWAHSYLFAADLSQFKDFTFTGNDILQEARQEGEQCNQEIKFEKV